MGLMGSTMSPPANLYYFDVTDTQLFLSDSCAAFNRVFLEYRGIGVKKWGEVPCAFIELKPQADAKEAEIIEFCRTQLARFKVPKRVIFGELVKADLKNILDLSRREIYIFAPLIAVVLWMGIYPKSFSDFLHPSVEHLMTQYQQAIAVYQAPTKLASVEAAQ